MEVSDPKLVWVEDRCYRFCDSTVWSSTQSKVPYHEDYYQQEYSEINNEECADDEIQTDVTNNGSYTHTFYVPRAFYGFIIGYKGTTKKKMETETHTSITVPKIDSKHEDIEIIGRTRANVISCRHRLDLLIESSKSKIRPTHFISIPLNTDSIMMNYKKFKDNILNDTQCESKSISEDIFVSAEKLHLTVGILRLFSENDKSEAAAALSSCFNEVIKPILSKTKQPIVIAIEGLNYMDDDPSHVSVFYAEVSKNDVLQEIANKTYEYFVKKNLMAVEHSEKVKLHMTLMKSSRLLKKHHNRPKKFNAAKIMEDYKDYSFGETLFNTINISKLSSTAANGHYEILTKIDISSQ